MNQPSGTALTEEDGRLVVYVADKKNNRIQLYDIETGCCGYHTLSCIALTLMKQLNYFSLTFLGSLMKTSISAASLRSPLRIVLFPRTLLPDGECSHRGFVSEYSTARMQMFSMVEPTEDQILLDDVGFEAKGGDSDADN
jgi:hypothetical protein